MIFTKYLDIIFIVFGSSIAIYAQAEEHQNTFVLILGILILMYGIYKLSSKIPSKNNKENDMDDYTNEF